MSHKCIECLTLLFRNFASLFGGFEKFVVDSFQYCLIYYVNVDYLVLMATVENIDYFPLEEDTF